MAQFELDYQPTAKQQLFHASGAYELLYGGAAGGGNLQQYELLYRGSIAAYQNGRLLGKKQSRELDRMRCYVQLGGRQPRPLQLRLGPDSALCGLRYSLYGGDDR